MAAHTVVARMQKVSADVIEAIREDRPIDDSRLETLRAFTTAVIEKRGWVSDNDISTFLAAGFSRAQILEVIVGISFKTLSNYTNHIVDTPLDAEFQSGAWSADERRLAS
jgi:alkylhydroperoxidase family enzyme